MSKAGSGLFKNTTGTKNMALKELLSPPEETTAIVWKHIESTGNNYPTSSLPSSFVIDVPKTKATPDGKLWTHNNATKHMDEALSSLKANPLIKISNPNLYTQFILYDYYKSLGKALKKGVKYGKTFKVGNWEFNIVPPRPGAAYPVVKHAQFTGLER